MGIDIGMGWLWNRNKTEHRDGPEVRTLTFKDVFGVEHDTVTGQIVNENTAMQVITFRSCVDIIASTISTLSLHTMERTEVGSERAPSHYLYPILHDEPSQILTTVDWLLSIMTRVLVHGNSYDFIKRTSNRVVSFHPLNNRYVKPILIDGNVVYEIRLESGKTEILTDREVIHVKGLTYDGVTGLSPLDDAARAIGSAIASDKFQAKSYANGMTLSGVLSHPQHLSPAAQENIRKAVNTRHGGADNAFKMLVLEEGIKYEPLSMTLEAAQFIEQRKLTVLDFARLMKVPPHMLADLEKGASFASIEHQGMSFWRYTLRPWVKKIEAELNRKLFTTSEKRKYFVEFDANSILRGDRKSQIESYAAGRKDGYMSLNEIRKKENEPPVPGGDFHYVPLNMVAVETLQSTNPPEEIPPAPPTEDERSLPAKPDLSPLYLDAYERLSSKETKAIQRAVKKHEGDTEALTEWLTSFYRKHQSHVEGVLMPIMEVEGRADSLTQEATDYCDKRLAEALDTIGGNTQ